MELLLSLHVLNTILLLYSLFCIVAYSNGFIASFNDLILFLMYVSNTLECKSEYILLKKYLRSYFFPDMVVLLVILLTIRKQQNKVLVLPSFIGSMFILSSLLLPFFFFFQIFFQKWCAFSTNKVIYSVYFQKGIKS